MREQTAVVIMNGRKRVNLKFFVGDLSTEGNVLLPQPPVFTEKSRPDDTSVNTIYLSPTLRYAGSNEFAPKNK